MTVSNLSAIKIGHEPKLSNLSAARQHSTDTHGYMEDVFGLCYLLGFAFMPRIRDLADQQLYRIDRDAVYPNLSGIFRGGVDVSLIREQWDQLARVAASLKNRVCPAHVVIQRLAHRSPADRLAKALTHLGRVTKTGEEVRPDWSLN
jgi:TnpA family transposase